VFFFLGRQDRWVPPQASVAYFEALNAPSKKLVWFERSRHEPFVDEPAKFNAAIAELVGHSAASRTRAGAWRSWDKGTEYLAMLMQGVRGCESGPAGERVLGLARHPAIETRGADALRA
jgi:hypothetical protein